MRKFRKFVMMNQATLKGKLEKVLKAHYKNVVCEDGFLYVKGSASCPILLTAHMDTVHKETVKQFIMSKEDGKTIISSPQGIGGDDRCGIWMIYKILTTTKYRPSILFCEDEEIGGVGSEKFVNTDYVKDLESLKYLVELDRAHADDAVYYSCGNRDFKAYIKNTIGYTEDYGSFSDIGHLSPACDKASVNLSCGYYRQHTLDEYVIFEEMQATLEKVKILLEDSLNCDAYDYQEYNRYRDRWDRALWYDKYWRNDYYNYSSFEEDDKKDDYDFTELRNLIGIETAKDVSAEETYEFQFYTITGEDEYVCNASSLEEAVGKLMMEHPKLCWNDIYDYATY